MAELHANKVIVNPLDSLYITRDCNIDILEDAFKSGFDKAKELLVAEIEYQRGLTEGWRDAIFFLTEHPFGSTWVTILTREGKRRGVLK